MAEKSRCINQYSTNVKVTGWNADESYPRDNEAYIGCKKNYFLSTHLRLGSDDSKTPISTTQAMLQQYYDVKSSRHKANKEFVRESCPYIMREGRGVYPMGLTPTDYTSTTSYSYRHPFPHLEKPFKEDLSPPPTIYRRFHVGILKLGNSKFLDEKLKLYCKPHLQRTDLPPYVYFDMIDQGGRKKQCGDACLCNEQANFGEQKEIDNSMNNKE